MEKIIKTKYDNDIHETLDYAIKHDGYIPTEKEIFEDFKN